MPPTINLLSRKHWTFRHRAVTEWQEMMRAELGVHDMGRLRAWQQLSHRVRIEIVVHHKGSFDPDNLHSVAKIPNDALKGLQCIVDDSAKWIDLDVREVVGKEVKTCFTITDLDAVTVNGKPRSLARYTTRRRASH
jgi:hypothetical protein